MIGQFLGILMSRAMNIDVKVARVNISIGTGASNSATKGAIIANMRPTKLQIPNAVALTEVGKSQGVAIKQQH